MTSRSQVFIADLLHSLDALGIESIDTAREVMRMLSLEAWHEILSPRTPAVVEAAITISRRSRRGALPTLAGRRRRESTSPERVTDSALGQVTISRLASPSAPVRPAWVNHVKPLERAVARGRARHLIAARSHVRSEPCLVDCRRVWSTTGALQRRTPCGMRLARHHAARDLPLRPSWSHTTRTAGPDRRWPRHGAVSRRCRARVIARLGALLPRPAGSTGVRGQADEGLPDAAAQRIRPWKPPEQRRRRAGADRSRDCAADPPSARGAISEWLAFADAAQTAGVQLRSLVPYPANRWPAALARQAASRPVGSPDDRGDGAADRLRRGASRTRMTALRERAFRRLREVEERIAEAAALARYASLATRVDATLLRRLRLNLVQRASASAKPTSGSAICPNRGMASRWSRSRCRRRPARRLAPILPDGQPALDVAFEHTRAVHDRGRRRCSSRKSSSTWRSARPRGGSPRDRAAASTGDRRDGGQRQRGSRCRAGSCARCRACRHIVRDTDAAAAMILAAIAHHRVRRSHPRWTETRSLPGRPLAGCCRPPRWLVERRSSATCAPTR